MDDTALLYIASTYWFIRSRSRLFTNNNKRRLKKDILSVSEATNALHSQEVETIIREIIYEVIDEVVSEAMKVSESETIIREIIDEVISEAMKVNVSEAMKVNVSEAMKVNVSESSLSESINIGDSWYEFDNLKIYHCHIPIVSNELSDSGDEF